MFAKKSINGMLMACLVLCLSNASAQTPALHWANSVRSSNSFSTAWDLVVSPTGYVYVTGDFVGTVDFDPGPGTFIRTSPNSVFHGFVQKLDTNGNFIWAAVFAGNNMTEGMTVTLDNSENVFASGMFVGTTDFDPGAGVANLVSAGFDDMYVVKLNSAGAFQWAKRTGAASRICMPYMARTDATGNVYTTGSFDGPMDFDPGAGTDNHAPSGLEDVFVQKLDASGNHVYTKTFGGGDYDYAESIALDGAGNIYLGGSFSSLPADFDPGAGTSNLSALGIQDYYIEKLTSAGNFVAVSRMGAANANVWGQTTLDAAGNICTSGSFDRTVDFNPGAGTANLAAGALTHGFIQKLNSALAFQWVKQIVCDNVIYMRSVATDAAGNIYAGGEFIGTADFDPGAGVVSRTSPVQVTFLLKLDGNGNFVWVAILNSTDYSANNAMALDSRANVYACGDHYGTTDFDPLATTYFMTEPTNMSWTLKLRQYGISLPAATLNLVAEALPLEVKLTWGDASASMLRSFAVERSVDGLGFEEIDAVASDGSASYAWVDHDVLSGVSYHYRLRLTDLNGEVSHSEVVSVQLPFSDGHVGIYPSPVEDACTLFSDRPIGSVEVFNALGQKLLEFDGHAEQKVRLDLAALPAGNYWIRLPLQGKSLPVQMR